MLERSRHLLGPALLGGRRLRAIPVLVALCAGLLLSGQAAHADPLGDTVCTLHLTFTFTAPPTIGGTVGYHVDAYPTNSSCTLPSRDTMTAEVAGSAGAGAGGTSLSRCGVLAGIGSWTETFGDFDTNVSGGTHVLAGTWLGGTMYVNTLPGADELRTNSVIILLPDPADPTANVNKIKTCAAGGTVTSIDMLGVQYLNQTPF